MLTLDLPSVVVISDAGNKKVGRDKIKLMAPIFK